MIIIRWLAHSLTLALFTPIYLSWSRRQSETQIEKMQRAAFDTPGSEAPIPLPVLIGGVALLIAHFYTGTTAFRLKGWQIGLSAILGGVGGVALFITSELPVNKE